MFNGNMETFETVGMIFNIAAIMYCTVMLVITKKQYRLLREEKEGGDVSKTSTLSKDRWNRKNYDSCMVRLPKGQKAELQELCKEKGISMNSVFRDAVDAFLKTDK